MSTHTPISVPSDPLYGHDAVIESIKQCFELLSRMVSFRFECIKSPPESGWSDDELPLEKFRILGFNERVVEILRHLPYVESNKPVYPSTQSISYLKDSYPFLEPEGEFGTKQPLVLERREDSRGNREVTPHDAYTHVPDEDIPEDEP
ncbi:hypothetical protein CDEST_12977 [Colletotrichum destructivum]|uniref:Uncharacterized protein n=1 Tax=Colletotrichum destructivum TaxID=34406 RepID=A0AAX4IXY6_9PEZI|nr:hypothetical protein CDEST_12977 [Colletotrichum destructivum]